MNCLAQLRFFPVLAVGVLSVVSTPAAGDVVRAPLTEGGRANYAIVLDANASPAERFAAEELAKYVRAMSGAELATLDPTDSRPRRILFAAGEALGKKFGSDNYALAIK